MLRTLIHKAYRWAQSNSIWVLHYNTGGCNGCDIEILDLLTPRFDVERLGILAEGSPRHADVLLCTGPVTRQSASGLWQIYTQMPSPKWVVAIGSCAATGGVFAGSDTILGGIGKVLPVDLYIPGCAARPEAIIAGLVQLKSALTGGGSDE